MTSTAEIKVRFGDIDVMGHVNNAVYLSYFEEARIHFFAELIGSEWDWKSAGVVLARNEIDYRLPILLNDRVFIETTCAKVGGKSMTVTYKVFFERKGKRSLCASGSSILVGYDYRNGTTMEIPNDWRSKLT